MSELLRINVNDHVEKKNGLSYLSWAWAWAEVLRVDPLATWEAVEHDGLPYRLLPDGSAMVKVAVVIKGHTKTCLLPVMNNRNQAVKNPDAFATNTAIVRCLTKCIAMHGLGLYIYAGEDLPSDPSNPSGTDGTDAPDELALVGALAEAETLEVLESLASRARAMPDGPAKREARDAYLQRKRALAGGVL